MLTSRRRALAWVLPALAYIVAVAAIVAAGLPLSATRLDIDGVPVEVLARRDRPQGPGVVIAHGFAGSQQLMYTYGYTLAHHGYTVYLLDFAGHGANRGPLRYNAANVASDSLQGELDSVVRYIAARHSGVALLGHSMGGSAVTQYGADHPEVAATINISSGWGEVTPERPRNYLMMVGAWEFASFREGSQGLLRQAGGAGPGVLYGDPARGTARKLVFVPAAEHISILLSPLALREAVAWLDGTFGVQAPSNYMDVRLAWLAVAYVAALFLLRPLAGWLRGGPGPQTYKAPSLGATVAVFAVAAVGAPLLARLVPDGWVPQAVAGYVTNYYALFGLLVLGGALLLGAGRTWPMRRWLDGRALPAALGLELYLFMTFGILGHYTASPLVPIAARLPWVLAMLPGALLYFGAGELLVRGQATPRAALVADLAHKGLALVSLTAAIFLLGAPFFLALLLPMLVLLFAGLVALDRWVYEAGGNPLVGALVSALATSGLMAAIFPLLR